MTSDTNLKSDDATTSQSPIIRYLGLIKAMSVIMAVLIIAALVTIVVTIYSRFGIMKNNSSPLINTIVLPEGTRASSASWDNKGQLLLLVEHNDHQQLWQFDQAGQLNRKIVINSQKP